MIGANGSSRQKKCVFKIDIIYSKNPINREDWGQIKAAVNQGFDCSQLCVNS